MDRMLRSRLIFGCVLVVVFIIGFHWKQINVNRYRFLNKDKFTYYSIRNADECKPVEYETINGTIRTIIVSIQICDDQTPDPKRPTSIEIRSLRRQMRQANVLVKSITLLTKTAVHYAVIANNKNVYKTLIESFREWPSKYCKRMSFSFHLMEYPEEIRHMKYLDRPGASYRQMMHLAFPNVNKIISFDTDVIMMKPLEDLTSHFAKFDENQIIGSSAMLFAEDKRFRMFPKPRHGQLDDGINIGVLLMRLDRWRTNMPNYLNSVNKWFDKYGDYFVFPTQDLFNVWLGTNVKHYYDLPCEWNVRLTLLTKFRRQGKSGICESANNGSKALHGAGGHFTDGMFGFSHTFRILEGHDMRIHSLKTLKYNLIKQFDELSPYGFNTRDEFKKFFLGELLESIDRVGNL